MLMIFTFTFRILQERENEISLRKWSLVLLRISAP